MLNNLTIKDHVQERKLFQRRIIIATVIILLLTAVLIGRLVFLQFFQHNRYVTMSKQNRLDLIPIEPNRGLIYDRNGVLLAEDVPIYSLDIVQNQVPNLKATIVELQKIIPIGQNSLDEFYKALSQHRGFEPVPLKMKLTEQEVARFYVDQYRFPGVMIDARMIRNYPLGKITAGVVGYVGRINANELASLDTANYSATNFIGKTGIEKYYENQLHGKVGYEQVEINAAGRIIRVVKQIQPIPGKDLHLTIDSNLQAIAQKALGDERGGAIVIDPKTGEVLALVSNPSFDPNIFIKGISAKQFNKLQNSPDNPLYNRAITGQFPPASTVKPFIALEGLDSKTITPDLTFDDPGWFQLPNTHHIYHDWKLDGHGQVNVTTAIIVSCDTFFYNLAVALGINKIDDILLRFGFGDKTGIDMPDESTGLVPSPAWEMRSHGAAWYMGYTVISGIGQGFMLATPIQLAYAAATLANRGIRFQPHLLLNQPLIPEDPVMLNDKSAWNTVIQAMQGVITSVNPWGTARIRFGTDVKYSVAAKTGTGQVYSKYGRDENETSEADISKKLRNNSLFIAFAPVKKPKIALAVVVENSPIAGTVARKILDYYLLKKSDNISDKFFLRQLKANSHIVKGRHRVLPLQNPHLHRDSLNNELKRH